MLSSVVNVTTMTLYFVSASLLPMCDQPNVNNQLVKPTDHETTTPIEENKNDDYMNHMKDDAILVQSLKAMHVDLTSGVYRQQFEGLHMENVNLEKTISIKEENMDKNRYYNILPSDTGTDYINADYVNMTISNDRTNRYIATQGPMQNTIVEFWRMVQQENSNLIVMLTTVFEGGRIKCAQYWPDLNEEMKLSPTFSIKLLSESSDATNSYVLRKIALSDSATGEYRVIRHLQYLAWPDHGVPSDRTLFMSFVDKLREMRQENEINGVNSPTIVHCSAGVGRTGMFIFMDAAISSINVNEPIYPLQIVKNMRDQRSYMVQNVHQYKFICECILAKYSKLTKTDMFL